jgi:hypothetical protein
MRTAFAVFVVLAMAQASLADPRPAGLRPGDEVVAWEPVHVAGPHAGTTRAEFVSEAAAPGPEPGLYEVAGQLQFHGVTRRVEFPARISVTPDEVAFDGTMTVRQSEFGMDEAARKTKDEVPVHVFFRGRREQAPDLSTRP